MREAETNRNWFLRGMRDGIPIALGYFAVAFALGIYAKNAGMTPVQSGIMSLLMVASAGQYAAITVIASGGGYLQMALTTLVVNLRYLLMSCSLSQKVSPDLKLRHRMGISYVITDEIFGISMSVAGRLNPYYNYGAGCVSVPGWTMGAVLGAAVGAILPQMIVNALSVALYGMFLAIIVPPGRKDKFIGGIVALSMALSYGFVKLPFLSGISGGMRIILLTVVISAAAALIRPIKDDEEGKKEVDRV